jgi:bacterioferritin-associated ferredoxin
MYVCICNALNEDTVRRTCVERGARCPDEVYSANGVERQCGRCVPEMDRVIAETHSANVSAEVA